MKSPGCIWNALTVLFIGLTLLACVWAGAIFMNPQGPFNPLKPPMLDSVDNTPEPSIISTPTSEVIFPTLPPEWTATFTPTPTPTVTRIPTETNTPAPTATVLLSPVGPTPTRSETPQPTRTRTRTPPPRPPTETIPPYPVFTEIPLPTVGYP